MNQALTILLIVGAGQGTRAADDDAALRAAVEKGLRRLEQGAASYVKNRQCFSCHHQATAISAFSLAKTRGLRIDDKLLAGQIEFTLDSFRSKKDEILKGRGIPGGNTMAAYALFALERGGYKPDDTTALLIEYLLIRQRPDGSWPALMKRPPSEGSPFTNNALALRGLKTYRPTATADNAELLKRIDAAAEKGRTWLRDNKPQDLEDRMYHLRGLIAAGTDRAAIDTARHELLKMQNDDGSWSQLPDLKGDAYATAGVLLALREAGAATTDVAFRKGLQYLVRTQQKDGSWFVETRSRPVQVFFDNGDPHGKSQFISFMATGWSVVACLEALPKSTPLPDKPSPGKP